MQGFDFQLRTRVVCEPGSIARLGGLARELGAKKALVVSDPGVVAAGHFARGCQSLEASGIEWVSFHDFRENPNTDHVEAGVVVARQCQPDLIVGLGGGSSMDCAKGINFIYSCGGKMQDYWGVNKAPSPMLPMIAVPTTSGTGSETQSFALISDAKTHVKMACGDAKAACRVAILDADLTITQPPRVTALTGIDAISHALETYVTKRRNPMSICYSREAWRRLAPNFGKVLREPGDREARAEMQLGACLAGMAIESSMLGAAHATANPLTARYHVTHGQAVALMLPHVIRFNGEEYSTWYAELWRDLNIDQENVPDEVATQRLADYVHQLVISAGLETRLSHFGVDRERLPELVQDASTQWTGSFNPRPLTSDGIRCLYETAL